MEYRISELAKLAGITTRTLRYYDQIGLLRPQRIVSGYRVYGPKEVDLLQQILFYRELGVRLATIKKIVCSKSYDSRTALEDHLAFLRAKKEQIGRLKEAHLGLAQAYVSDPRFKRYYDSIEKGCAQFLLDALKIYCK